MEFSFKKMGAALANFFTGNPELEAHQKEFTDAMAADVQDVTAQMSALQTKVDTLTEEKSALQTEVDTTKAQVATLKADADKYAEIKEEYAQLKAFEEKRKQALGVVVEDGGAGKQQQCTVNEDKKAQIDNLKSKFPNLTAGLLD